MGAPTARSGTGPRTYTKCKPRSSDSRPSADFLNSFAVKAKRFGAEQGGGKPFTLQDVNHFVEDKGKGGGKVVHLDKAAEVGLPFEEFEVPLNPKQVQDAIENPGKYKPFAPPTEKAVADFKEIHETYMATKGKMRDDKMQYDKVGSGTRGPGLGM